MQILLKSVKDKWVKLSEADTSPNLFERDKLGDESVSLRKYSSNLKLTIIDSVIGAEMSE